MADVIELMVAAGISKTITEFIGLPAKSRERPEFDLHPRYDINTGSELHGLDSGDVARD
jgi:hypothetical protein